MESFKNATQIRLRGPHGRYLWANDDHFRISQHRENRNCRAFWRVERCGGDKGGIRKSTVRLKSCFNTYLTADEHHHHDLAILGCSGRRVVQMRPENVEADAALEWEPVKDGAFLKLRTCHGTFLRANATLPPWNSSVSHDLPRHDNHQRWLLWEVEIVRVPDSVPLEQLHHATLNERKQPKQLKY